MLELFERASKKKLRFETDLGTLSVEDLWDLPLQSTRGVNLDDMAKKFSNALKEEEEESFVEKPKPNKKLADLRLRFAIVKRIIEVQLEAREKAEQQAERKQRAEKIKEILARKEDAKLERTSEKKLLAELEELEG
jgi:hypothetical protein